MCKKIIYPNRNNVMNGQGACKYCAPNAPVEPDEAVALMRDHGFRTLVDFPGTGKAWLSECIAAGHLVAPRYANVRGRRGGCQFCKRRGVISQAVAAAGAKLREAEALADMKSAGFQPVDLFKDVASPWLSLHSACGQLVSPNLNNVRTRGACCEFCAKYGLDPDAPAWLYILAHMLYGASKIGITGQYTQEDRVARFERDGWKLIAKLPFTTGRDARKAERAVIDALRPEGRRKKAGFLMPAQMPVGGSTETFDARVVPASLLLSMALSCGNLSIVT
ncbi:hypothetical protein [Actinacidiphila acidipaludis]|uniref:Uncharacterized protein n=1 Tax=Actinacidiphila acidipaludis TaxID=2873382 RepID=A0ABS7QID0_9ACTN|nr:hypothetical protein [Streptomyces acidipaludis]MBY8882723.1 hypothetical protein [Streptomyces acidipaludis]